MQARLVGVIPSDQQIKEFVVFGYCTKGLPGVELIGPIKWGKTTKEKIIFLCRELNLRLPLKRFVLCIEEVDYQLRPQELRYLEFPLLVLLFSLADFIPLKRTDDILTSGKVESDGRINIPSSLEELSPETGKIMSLNSELPVKQVFENYLEILKFNYLKNQNNFKLKEA